MRNKKKGIIYALKATDQGDSIYKIGTTRVSVDSRIKYYNRKYNVAFEVLHEKNNVRDPYHIETLLKWHLWGSHKVILDLNGVRCNELFFDCEDEINHFFREKLA